MRLRSVAQFDHFGSARRDRSFASTMHRRAAALLITLLVGSCSLPTFNPPKLKGTVAPAGPVAATILVERAGQ